MSGSEEFERDPGLRALAERLARADFSAESRVRASLRARLLRRRRGQSPRLALTLAAAALVLMAPFRARLRSLVEGTSGSGRAAPLSLPVLSGSFPAAGAGPAASPFVTAVGRVIESPGRRLVVWELEGRTFALERRQVTNAEIFKEVL